MNNRLLIVGIAVLLLAVGLSGCNENMNSGKVGNQDIEILNYNVTTHWTILERGKFTYVVEQGFYHNMPNNTYGHETYYKISGTVKNIAGRNLDSVRLDCIFYDKDAIELYDTRYPEYEFNKHGDTISNLPKGYTEEFSIGIPETDIWGYSIKYWDKFEDFDFVISGS